MESSCNGLKTNQPYIRVCKVQKWHILYIIITYTYTYETEKLDFYAIKYVKSWFYGLFSWVKYGAKYIEVNFLNNKCQ